MKNKAVAAVSNPYMDGRREWNERYGSYIAQARNWRFAAIVSLLLAVVCAGGLIHVASQSQIVPYIVQVDRLGQAANVERMPGTPFKPDNALIVASLSRWITDVRTIYGDAAALRTILKEGYSMVNEGGAAYLQLNDFMRTNDPFRRASGETVSVAVASVQPISGDTWRIEWQEETRETGSHTPKIVQWQATVSIVISPPRDEKTLRLNPLGLYVNTYNWSQRL